MPKRRELAIWLGVHMDEWLTQKAFDLISPLGASVLGLAVISRNLAHYRKNSQSGKLPRFIGQNMVSAFGQPPDKNPETHDAEFFLAVTGMANVWDLHGNYSYYDFPFYGAQSRRDKFVTGVASLLDTDNALILPASHVAGQVKGYVGWDLGVNSPNLQKIPELAERLCEGWVPPTRPMKEWIVVGGLFKAIAREHGLAKYYQPFEQFPEGMSQLIDARFSIDNSWPLYALCSDDAEGMMNPDNPFHCEVVTPYTPQKATYIKRLTVSQRHNALV